MSVSMPGQHERDAKYSELQEKLDQIERHTENRDGHQCPECGEFRNQHRVECAIAEFFEEPVRGLKK